MIEWLKEWFDLTAKTNWIKHIDREVDKYICISKKLNMQADIVNALLKRYKEIYGEDLRTGRMENKNEP